jgi:hypothetical protein
MSNDLPADHSARRMNYQHAATGGLMPGSSPGTGSLWNAIKPSTLFNAIGHAVTRGPNSPSQLTHTFGN